MTNRRVTPASAGEPQSPSPCVLLRVEVKRTKRRNAEDMERRAGIMSVSDFRAARLNVMEDEMSKASIASVAECGSLLYL